MCMLFEDVCLPYFFLTGNANVNFSFSYVTLNVSEVFRIYMLSVKVYVSADVYIPQHIFV